ncbi:MAG: NAD(P)H-dependent oxidoreductase subunit E [Acidimicrobiales bacterium]
MTGETGREAWSEAAARATIEAHASQRGPLLPVLRALQETFGYVDDRAIALVGHALNLSRADVYGVLTFYSDLRTAPQGRVRLQVCRGEACQSVGANALVAHAKTSLGVEFGETTPDGAVTLDEVFCLGNCALGPTVAVDGRPLGRVEASDFDRLVNHAASTGEL